MLFQNAKNCKLKLLAATLNISFINWMSHQFC